MFHKAFSALSAPRLIAPLGVTTPVVVPSFSSRGFPSANDIFHALRLDLYGVCLLSAFDLARGRIKADLLQAADWVLIDSGLYEVRAESNHCLHGTQPSVGSWDRAQYRAWLASVPPTADVAVVSYDHYGPLQDQYEGAVADFACCRAAGNFLIKPTQDGQYLNPEGIDAASLSRFSIVGVTEKELGSSPQQRCVSLLKLRMALSTAGQDMPIHVFGAITPRAMLAYFLCGADLFDGLNWLRYEYTADGIAAMADLPPNPMSWNSVDTDRWLSVWRRNLRALQRLQTSLRSFAQSKDLGALCIALPWADQIVAGVAAAWHTQGEVH